MRFLIVRATALVLLLAAPALAADPPAFAPREIVVRFRSAVPAPVDGLSSASFSSLPSGAARALARVNAVGLQPLKAAQTLAAGALSAQAVDAFEPLTRTYRVYLPAGADVSAAVAAIAADPAVEIAEPNHLLRLSAAPNDASYGNLWGLKNTGQSGGFDIYDPASGTAGDDIDAETAWEAETGDSSVIVAVIDSGLEIAHPDIAGNVWTNPNEINNGLDDDGNGKIDDLRGWDFGGDGTVDDNNVADDCGDEAGHGTHVAGIVGALGNNGAGVTGTAWDVTVMPLKVAYDDLIFGCVLLQSDVAEAITYATQKGADVINMSLGGTSDSVAMRTAADAAKAAGVVLVAAAGNSGSTSAEYPAAYASVLGVAATNRNDARAGFSNFGSFVSLAAPGVSIYSTLPASQGSYGYKSGTSMASPMVAGVAALVRSQYPGLSAAQVETRLLDSCEATGSSGIGAGRVNAARALLGVTGVSPTQAPSGQTVSFTVSGVAFQSGMAIRLTKSGASSVNATNVTVNAHNQATCDFNVPASATGTYNVQVVVGQAIQTLSDAVEIYGLDVTGAAPSVWPSGAPTTAVTLSGRNFGAGMTVFLRRSGQSDIAGANLTINSETSATVEFDLTSAAGGRWDVVVSSNGFNAALSKGLAVTTALYQVVSPPTGTATRYVVGNVTLDWPANATPSGIDIDIDAAPALPAIDAARDPFVATNIGVDLQQVGATPTFDVPFKLTLPFSTNALEHPDKVSALALAYFNTVTGRWQPIDDIEVDAANETVSGTADHFSHFQIVQHVPSLNLDRTVAFPNPFRPDRGHDRIVFDFLFAGSTVKVFDLAGRLVRELSDHDGDGRIDWVGVTNDDGERVASGVYYYLATGGGHKKTGRLAVLR